MCEWPTPNDGEKKDGWKIDPGFLRGVKHGLDEMLTYNYYPDLEEIESCLIMAASIVMKNRKKKRKKVNK